MPRRAGRPGFSFITTGLLLFGYSRAEAEEKAWKALERLSLTEAAHRKVAAYSKGMRQRVRLAQAIAHEPELLVLDEPLNGLDPLVRAETIALFRAWAAQGRHVILSSHVLQEVDVISDQVVLIANGMIVAEGEIRNVREEIHEHPSQFIIRCRDASRVASLLFNEDHITEIKLNDDRMGLLVMTRDREQFSRALGRIATQRPQDRRRHPGRRERGRPVRVPDRETSDAMPRTDGHAAAGTGAASAGVDDRQDRDCGARLLRKRAHSGCTGWRSFPAI